jgi:hypothetical protein
MSGRRACSFIWNPRVSAPRPGSGSERRQRVHKVDTRWDGIEHASLAAAAQTAGLSKGAYIRALVLGCPGPRARRSPSVDIEALARAIAALNKVGANLNQIARILNMGGSVSIAHASYTALAETRAAVAEILQLVGRRDRA